MGSRGPVQGDRVDDAAGRTKTDGIFVVLSEPEMPKSLSEEAAAEWVRLIPRLREVGTLSRVDTNGLARYCNDYVLYHQALHRAEVYQLPDEKVKAIGLTLTIAKAMERFEKLWGLNPTDRARMPMPEAADEDEGEFDVG